MYFLRIYTRIHFGKLVCIIIFLDAMAIVGEFGKPTLFITVTCNPEWLEIKKSLFPGQSPSDRPDLCARVFKLKLKELMKDLTHDHFFGKCLAYVSVVEFQKRGLPHSHILLILNPETAPKTPEEFDKFVSAEIPGLNNPVLRALVLKHMIHGPCGHGFRSPCMCDNGDGSGPICSKSYPKDFCPETQQSQGSFPIHRRRSPAHGGETAVKQMRRNGEDVDFEINNQWVVPYNAFLLLKFNCHINIEICNTVVAVKYLFKYVYKGHDRAMFSLQNVQKTLPNPAGQQPIDEIQKYIDSRYIAPPEAVWRIFKFDLQSRNPGVQRLSVHLPDHQQVRFDPSKGPESIQRALESSKRTHLTAWFELNISESLDPLSDGELNDNPPASELRYVDIPKYYRWMQTSKKWKRRVQVQTFRTIGRPYSAHPREGERYYLRRLLFYVRGAKSFEEVRTVNDQLCETFKMACENRGLLQNDNEWNNCLIEAIQYSSPSYIRTLFASILVHCEPTNPLTLWENHKLSLGEDFRHISPSSSDDQLCNTVLHELSVILHQHQKSLSDFNLPEPDQNNVDESPHSREVNDALNYDVLALQAGWLSISGCFTLKI